jgi:hypothetical protein
MPNLNAPSGGRKVRPFVDLDTTRAFLKQHIDPSRGCVELRILEGNIDPRTRRIISHETFKTTIATWGDDADQLVDELVRVDGISVYFTVNPVDPALKARASKFGKQRATTTDDDIVCLRWLFIDFDAKRPTGISSTDEEKSRAWERLQRVLNDHPEFVPSAKWGCSGNGYWMFVLLPDYPNDEDHRELIARATDWFIKLYSDDRVEIDPACKNPARIGPLVGTWKCKGESTPDRPHRLVTMESPAGKVLVPFDLKAWAALHAPAAKPQANGHAPNPPASFTGRASSGSAGDVERRVIAYLATIEPSVSGQKGSDKTFGAACRVGPGFDLTEDEAYRLIDAHYNPRCVPPWSEKELRHKLADAYKKVKTRGRLLKQDRRRDRKAAAPAADGRVEIEVTTRRHEVLEKTIQAIARDADLYCRGESLGVVIQEQGDTAKLPGGVELRHAKGNLRFIPVATSVLGCRLTRVASFFRWVEDGHGEMVATDCHPPDWAIAAVADHRYWPGVRSLLTITECPFILADGSLAKPGFDPRTGTLYRPSFDVPPLPPAPTASDAGKAVDRLYELVYQFPFEDTFSFAVWVANLLTCIQRPVIAEPVPGFAYNGNAAGCGKGLLIDIHGNLVYGSNVATRTYPADPAEAAKVKLALALAAVPIVHFDNLTEGGSYGGGVIDSALTTTVASDRILGQSRDSGNVPLRPVWTLSGNNVSPIKDADRRWIPCNLKTTLEKPYERDDIQEKNLRDYVLKHRAELVHAALVILKAHAVAGRPIGPADPKNPTGGRWAPLGSYGEWDSIVRGAVWYATEMDCLETQRRGASEKPDRLDKAALLEGWLEIDPDRKGRTIEEAIGFAADNPTLYPTLRSALLNLSRDGKLPSVKTVTYKLRSMKNTPVNRMRFETRGENRNHQKLWLVVAC